MALRLCTGLVDAMSAHHPTIVIKEIANITFIAATSKINRAAGSFITDGFRINDYIYSTHADNGGPLHATLVEATDITLDAAPVNDAAAGTETLAAARGGSFQNLFRNGILFIFGGTRPGTADLTEGSTALVEITKSSGAFTPGTDTNGINFGDATAGKVSKAAAETWSGSAGSTGTAVWFRFYSNAETTGASDTAIRFDGSCGVSGSGADLIMSSTTITSGGTETIDTFDIELPDGV